MIKTLKSHFETPSHLVVSSGRKKLHFVFLANKCIHIYTKECPKDLFELDEAIETMLISITNGESMTLSLGDDVACIIDKNLVFRFLRNGKEFFAPLLQEESQSGKEGYSRIRIPIEENAKIYGLGDKMAQLNKKGYVYRSWNTDDPSHQDEQFMSLYKSINYLLLRDKGVFYGLYFPSTYRYEYDLGRFDSRHADIYAEKGFLDFYFFYGETPKSITSSYSRLIGYPYFIRMKMLGNQQSRWSYENEAMVKDVFKQYKKNRLPLDYIHMDIHYMDGYRDLTIDKTRFPNVKALSTELGKGDVELVAINDAGLKLDDQYELCATCQEKGWLAKNEDGSTYVGRVWPGDSVFPSYVNPECRAYFHQKAIEFVTENGISGIWNDMNEPFSFTGELPMNLDFSFGDRKLLHEEYHNVYGETMCRCYTDVFEGFNRRPYCFTRAAMATTPKYAFAWNGDNHSLWHHLVLSIPQILSCSMSNLMFDGVDIGGFGSDCTKELLIRWCEANILMPFFRNHSSLYTRSQEPYAFDQECTDIYREYLNLRYRFVPYLYDLARKMATRGETIVRPLFFNYPDDEKTYEINDEYMVGDDVLMAPILGQGQVARAVYLPRGVWIDYFTNERIEGGRFILKEMALDETGIYIRENSIIPEFHDLLHLNKKKITDIVFHLYGEEGTYELYEDDGNSLNYKKGEYNLYRACFKDGVFTLECKRNRYRSPYQRVIVIKDGCTYEAKMEAKVEVKLS